MKKTSFLFFAFFFVGVLYSQNSDPKLPNGKSFRANGRDLVFYPSLKISSQNSAKQSGTTPMPGQIFSDVVLKPFKGNAQTKGTRGNSATISQSFGSYQGFSIIKKENSITTKSNPVSSSTPTLFTGGLSAVPNSFVLYNKTEQKFEATDGLIQVEVSSANANLALDSIFAVKEVSSFRNYRLLKPIVPANFAEVLEQIKNSGYVEQAHLILSPPKVTPK